MQLAHEINDILDAIDQEIDLLSKVALEASSELDTRATQDMTRMLNGWDPFQDLPDY